MPIKGNTLECPSCRRPQSQINFVNCEYCGTDLGAPNVNIVSTDNETSALKKRYDDAKLESHKLGTSKYLDSFEIYFNQNVHAIINLNLSELKEWIIAGDSYKNYYRGVVEGNRKIAALANDQKRTIVDSIMHGFYGQYIIHAALTLNQNGLISYGNYGVIIDENAIKLRSSLLEENSYNFVINHHLGPENPNIPIGYRSNWLDKTKLAVSKLYKKINNSDENEFCLFVLKSNGKRQDDEFIEVHVYKEITTLAIRNIYIPISKNKTDELLVKVIEIKCSGKVTRI